MTGTSLDGVDLAACKIGQVDPDDFDTTQIKLLAFDCLPYPKDLKQRLQALITQPQQVSLLEIGECDQALGQFYAEMVQFFLKKEGIKAQQIQAIGSHGQTIFHHPQGKHPFSWQIGNGHWMAKQLGIAVISHFRQADIVQGGQGAPLAPGLHRVLFSHPTQTRVVANIGGIANITLLQPQKPIIGLDTGPGNTLLDQWCSLQTGMAFDRDGIFARQGQCQEALLQVLLQDSYFAKAPPKSTGREHFNLVWLQRHLAQLPTYRPEDVQATLVSLTASSMVQAILAQVPEPIELYLCGGGCYNQTLVAELQAQLPKSKIATTAEIGIHPDAIEAVLIAWLAYLFMARRAFPFESITGASQASVLGMYCPG